MGAGTYQRMKAKEEIDLLEAQESAKQLMWLHRPILVHARKPQDDGYVCECGHCDSTLTHVSQTIPHFDVMFDIDSGERIARHELTPNGKLEFDRLCNDESLVTRVDLPWLCHAGQLDAVQDFESKIIFAFGGQQAGKTELGKGKLIDYWLLNGGRNRIFYWVANEMKATQVAVTKLCREHAGIPRQLIMSYPVNERASDQTIHLIDGSRIELHHARGTGGDNLKGKRIYGGVMDEATGIAHKENFDVFIGRTTMTGAQIVVPTTPKAGHWLQDFNTKTATYDVAREQDRWPNSVKVHITAMDNPWARAEDIQEIIDSSGGKDNPGVKRNVFGMWVADGDRLWPYFTKDEQFVVSYDPRQASGMTVRTEDFGRARFKTSKAQMPWVLGMDFNYAPMSAVVMHVLSPSEDPDKWIVYASDEVVFNARDEHHFVGFLRDEAGTYRGRGGPGNMFACSHCIVDATGFHKRATYRANSAPWASIMKDAGFVVQPPERKQGTERNPPRRVRIAFLNKLMFEKRLLVSATCENLIRALECEVNDGTGDTAKRSGTAADRMSGVTDALGYAAYGLLYYPERKRQRAAQA